MNAFIPARGLSNPHLQTLLPRFIRQQAQFEPVWQTLNTPDNDFLDLAWSEDWRSHRAQEKPLFVLFHGLEGSFHSPYAHGLMQAFRDAGWLAVMMHFRGCSGKPNTQARAYHSGEIEDARFFLESVAAQHSHPTRVAVGISLGGNMLANYLAHHGHSSLLSAACIVSAPLDLSACSLRIEQGFSKVYHAYLLSSLKRNALIKHHLIAKKLNVGSESLNQEIRNIQRLFEFDDKITAPLHGFQDAQDYYTRCSGLTKLEQIRIPTQIIHAKDDPFMTEAVIPQQPLPNHINYHLLDHGGHVGFITGSIVKPRFWLEEALPSYYESLKIPS